MQLNGLGALNVPAPVTPTPCSSHIDVWFVMNEDRHRCSNAKHPDVAAQSAAHSVALKSRTSRSGSASVTQHPVHPVVVFTTGTNPRFATVPRSEGGIDSKH